MSEEQDDSSKTEEPTQKRLEDAEKKGDIARSQEINHWFMFFAIALAIMIFSGDAARRLTMSFIPFLEQPHLIAVDPGALVNLMGRVMMAVAYAVLPMFAMVVVFAFAASALQHWPTVSAQNITPQFSRISPMKGFGRYFSMKNLVEFAKSLAKIAIIGAVALYAVWPKRDWLPLLITMEPIALVPVMERLAMLLLGGVLAVMTVVAGGDFLFQKLSRHNRLRMSKQELKDEMKQSEGDPLIKGRLRALRMQKAKQRMMAAVPTADVIVVNPTHYAVALKYEHLAMQAPKVVAKGVDNVAAKIREIAQAHDVPILEAPPLARALYTVDLDAEVPVEHYKAVAEIIGYVMRLKGKLPGKPVPPRILD